ncbi:MAG: hypothetical protein ACJ790_16845 [Myxococcaceae bacterium]
MKRLAPLVIVLGALLIAVAWWWNVSAVGSDDAATESSVVALEGPAGAKHGSAVDHVRSMDDGDASGTASEHATAHEHPDEMPLAAKSLVISASEKVLKDGGAANASSDRPDATKSEEENDTLYSDGEPTVCSMRTELKTTVDFINDCAAPIDVSWIDFNCRERVYFEIKPGDHLFEGLTYVTHVWRVRDHASQKLLQQIVPMSEAPSVVHACGDHTVTSSSPPDAGSRESESFCAPTKIQPAEPPLCSLKWKTAPVDLLFVNNCLGTTVSLNWVDFDCKEQTYALLNPGAQRKQPTFVSHTWRIRDASTGELYREFVPRTPNARTVATCVCQ